MSDPRLALVADRREMLVMHSACASAAPTREYWHLADLVNAVGDLLTDRCAWCSFRLGEVADPHFEVRPKAHAS